MFCWIADRSWSWKWASQIKSKCWWGWLQNWYRFVTKLIADIRSIIRINIITFWTSSETWWWDALIIKRANGYSIIRIYFFNSWWKSNHWYIGWRYISVVINRLDIELGNISIWIDSSCNNDPKSYKINLPAGWRFHFSVIKICWGIFGCKRIWRDTVN